MKQRQINNKAELINAFKFISEADKYPFLMSVSHDVDARSYKQNRLYRLWISVISNETGNDKLEVEYSLRRDFVLPILEQADPDMLEISKRFRDSGFFDTFIKKIVSTTMLGKKQFAQMLTDADSHYSGNGIALPHPDDLYFDAVYGGNFK